MGFIISNKDKGLGDSIERFTQATGIKTAVEKGAEMFGISDCGCNKRKEQLNKLVPFKNNNNGSN